MTDNPTPVRTMLPCPTCDSVLWFFRGRGHSKFVCLLCGFFRWRMWLAQ